MILKIGCVSHFLNSSNKARKNMPDLSSNHCDAMWDDAQMAVTYEVVFMNGSNNGSTIGFKKNKIG